MTIDLYAGLLPVLFPVLSRKYGLDLATVGLVALAYSGVGSVSQPLFGWLADRHGRRALIIGSLIATIPAILLFTQFTGGIAFLTGALVGILAASTAPLLLVMAQQLMQGRAGVASGLILGLGFVTGAIGVPITGAIADAFSIQTAMRAQSLVILLAIPIALLLPSELRMRQIQERGSDRP